MDLSDDWDDGFNDDSESACGNYSRAVASPVTNGLYSAEDDSADSLEEEEADVEEGEEEPDEYVNDDQSDDLREIDAKAARLSPDMRHAYNVVCQLMSSENHLHNWPFMSAVDSKNGALWDYDTIVKDPVWLKQVRDDLLEGRLQCVTEVFRRLRLMFRNCYRYNGPQHGVTRRALRLESIMEQQIQLMPPHLAEQASLVATEGEEALVDAKVISRRRNHRAKSQPAFFSHVLHWVRHERADREKECRRQQLESKRQKRQEKEQRIVDWERRLLLLPGGQALRSMWQLPQMTQFVHLSLRALHIFEVPMYEMERMLMVPQSSETLAILMSSLVSSPLTRIKLADLPPMPYAVWTAKLAARVQHWYRVYAREKSRPAKLFDSLGIEPTFWHVLGPRSPFETRLFHELSFFQRVSLVKALCEYLFHNHKTVQECVMETAEAEPRESVLGVDRHGFEYFHLPHLYVRDVRVYRRVTWSAGAGAEQGEEEQNGYAQSVDGKPNRGHRWSRAQLALKRRTVARALQWTVPEQGSGVGARYLCLGAAYTNLDAGDGDEEGEVGEHGDDEEAGEEALSDDTVASAGGGGSGRRKSSAGRRGRRSRGGAKRGGRKSAGLREGPQVWCDASSGDEADGGTCTPTRAAPAAATRGKRGRGGASSSRGRGRGQRASRGGRGRGQSSWAAEASDDESRDGSPPSKRGRRDSAGRGRARKSASRKAFSAETPPAFIDPNACPHCGMSLRSERARSAHRCFKENMMTEGRRHWHVSSAASGAGEVAPVTPSGRRGRPSKQRSWRSCTDSPSLATDQPQQCPPVTAESATGRGSCGATGDQNGTLCNSTAGSDVSRHDDAEDDTAAAAAAAEGTALSCGTTPSRPPAGPTARAAASPADHSSDGDSVNGADLATADQGLPIESNTSIGDSSPMTPASAATAEDGVAGLNSAPLASDCATGKQEPVLLPVTVKQEPCTDSCAQHLQPPVTHSDSTSVKAELKCEHDERHTSASADHKSAECKSSASADDKSAECKSSASADDKSAECKSSASADVKSAECKSSADAKSAITGNSTKTEAKAAGVNSSANGSASQLPLASVKAAAAGSPPPAPLSSSGDETAADALPLPPSIEDAEHVQLMKRGAEEGHTDHFLLVADTFDSLRALIDQFTPSTSSLSCEVQLHRALTALLQELEPLEAKISQSVCNMRKRLCQEWLSYLDRPANYHDPNEDAWRERETEPESAAKKRAKTPTPPPPEPDQRDSEDEWCDGRRKMRSRRAKRKPVNYCVDGGDERRRGQATADPQVSSRGRVRRLRQLDDFDYNVNERYDDATEAMCDASPSDDDGAGGARRTGPVRALTGPRGSWRQPADGDGGVVAPLPAWNSDLASSLSGSVEARVRQLNQRLAATARTPPAAANGAYRRLSTAAAAQLPNSVSSTRPLGVHRIVMNRGGAAVLSSGATRPALAADKYVLRMGADGLMYMEKVGVAQLSSPSAASPAAGATAMVVRAGAGQRLPGGTLLLPASQASALLGGRPVRAVSLGTVPASSSGNCGQLQVRLPLSVAGSQRPLLASTVAAAHQQSPRKIFKMGAHSETSTAPAPGAATVSAQSPVKLQMAPPPMLRAPQLVSSSVRFMSATAPALPVTASASAAAAAPAAPAVVAATAGSRPAGTTQQGKVVVIRSGGEQKLGVLLGNGQVVQLSDAQASVLRRQAELRNRPLPELGTAAPPSTATPPPANCQPPVSDTTVSNSEPVSCTSSCPVPAATAAADSTETDTVSAGPHVGFAS